MDAAFQYFALLWIGWAIYSGLHAIASAIKWWRVVEVKLSAPIDVNHRIDVVHRNEDGPSS